MYFSGRYIESVCVFPDFFFFPHRRFFLFREGAPAQRSTGVHRPGQEGAGGVHEVKEEDISKVCAQVFTAFTMIISVQVVFVSHCLPF